MAKRFLRTEVPEDDRWDLTPLYPSAEKWEEDFRNGEKWLSSIANEKTKDLSEAKNVKEVLDTIYSIERKMVKLYTFASQSHHEDITENNALSRFQKIQSLLFQFREQLAWFEPKLLGLPEKKEKELLRDPLLEEYRFTLEKIFRERLHTLSEKEERLLSLAQKPLTASQKAFASLNDADFTFPSPTDSEGKEHPLTHGSYSLLARSFDRTLRKNAFCNYLSTYKNHEQGLSELLRGTVEKDIFFAKAKNFPSALEAALFPHNLPREIYLNLIDSAKKEISALHDYYRIRKKALGLSELHLYDMQVPLTKDLDVRMDYDEAAKLVVESVEPLGKEYQKTLEKGLFNDRWVDRYENQNKRSGAYSGGCYDSFPYILMNYKGTIRDLFTLAHEAGHSMHSYLSHTTQPYHMGDYSIFVAEVASTLHEELLFTTLMKKAKSRDEKLFYLTTKLDDFRSTFFRQTMFAEFELFIHDTTEKGTPLTSSLLKEKYLELNRFYFGNDVTVDEEIALEWGRIPHFYYNFYVFQYATGISAAGALASRILKGGQKEREDYLHFLQAGYSVFPLDALQIGGIDMSHQEPIFLAIDRFRDHTKELAAIIDEC